MNWEELTAQAFEHAVKKSQGLCLLPIGVIEKHGDHLPLGQDTLFIHKLCSEATKIEEAVVFPFYFFGQVNEAKHQPGTVALKTELLPVILENTCDEIARNGFNKILIVNVFFFPNKPPLIVATNDFCLPPSLNVTSAFGNSASTILTTSSNFS